MGNVDEDVLSTLRLEEKIDRLTVVFHGMLTSYSVRRGRVTVKFDIPTTYLDAAHRAVLHTGKWVQLSISFKDEGSEDREYFTLGFVQPAFYTWNSKAEATLTFQSELARFFLNEELQKRLQEKDLRVNLFPEEALK